MVFFLLASIAGLFPSLTVPIGLGWKEIHAFDLAFVACIAFAMRGAAIRSPDWRLIAAGFTSAGAMALALWAHPSPEGARIVLSVAYSVAVLLTVSHLRIDALRIRVDRTILWPLFLAIGVAGVTFLIENAFGVTISRNSPRSLPSGVHRLGGFTGANAIILFMCLAAPLVRKPALTLFAILLPAMATLSRSLLGVGVAVLVNRGARGTTKDPTRTGILAASWLAVALGLFAYGFAVVPVKASQRTPFRLSLDAGGYLTLHHAALRMLWSSPIVGVGPGQFVERYRTFTSREERARVYEEEVPGWAPHSALLGLAAEEGLIGLAGFGWLILEIYKRLRRTQDRELRDAAAAGLTGLLVGGYFVDWLTLKGLWLWIGLLVASSFATASPSESA
jgi:hypothetical protein